MRTFRALVVDDDTDLLDIALESAAPERGIHVSVGRNLDEADALIADHYFNVAFVDIELDRTARPNVDGLTILRLLADVRPSCRRLLLTGRPSEYRAGIFDMLDPANRVIDGAIDKENFDHLFVDYVEVAALEWLRAPVDVGALELLYEQLQGRLIRGGMTPGGRRVATTLEEVDYVVSSAFGQDIERDADEGKAVDDIAAIDLELLEGGKSRSIVAYGRPRTSAEEDGIQCVVKIGPRHDTLEELRRYDRYVRFRLSLHRRVELLGHAVGDTLGAICYSFAGSSPRDIVALQSLFNAQDERAHATIQQLLGDKSDWRVGGPRARDLAGFFRHAYRLDALKVIAEADAFSTRRAASFGATKSGSALVFPGGGRVELPVDADLVAGNVRGFYDQSVVHGDLNASNVIVSSTNEIVLIDFRHTERGPVTLDLAGLEASLRLTPQVWADVGEHAIRDLAIERKLWAHDFSESDDWWSGGPDAEPPYWARVSATLMGIAIRTMSVSRRQHAVTCLLYALRVFRVTQLDPAARMRLLVWTAAIKETLARLPKERRPAAAAAEEPAA